MRGPYTVERISPDSEGKTHWRIADGQDNRIATCYTEMNANDIVEKLNRLQAQQPTPDGELEKFARMCEEQAEFCESEMESRPPGKDYVYTDDHFRQEAADWRNIAALLREAQQPGARQEDDDVRAERAIDAIVDEIVIGERVWVHDEIRAQRANNVRSIIRKHLSGAQPDARGRGETP